MKVVKNKVIKILIFIVCIAIISSLIIFKGKNNEDYIDKLISKYNPVGASVAIIENGEIVDVRNYGYANIEKNILVEDNTQFKVASISKSITAYAVMQLVDEGKLDLDEPVNKYLKEWKIPESKYDENKVTLRNLMSHTSGISPSDELGYTYPLPNIQEALKMKDVKLNSNPGVEFNYSEFSGFGICQLVVEDVMNKKFEDYMIEDLFKKIGMNNTDYNNIVDNKLAIPYAGFNDGTDVVPIVMNGAGGVSTTSRDLANFAVELMDYYENSNKEMFKSQKNTESIAGIYGLGIIPRKMSNGITVYEHNGTLTGWNSQMVLEPVSKSGIVILTNSDSAFYLTYDLMENWSERRLGEKVIDTQMSSITDTISIAIYVLISLFILIFIVDKVKIRKGKIKLEKYKDNKKKVNISILIIAILAIAYYIFIYTEIPFEIIFNMSNYYVFSFLPYNFRYINIILILLATFFINKSRYVKVKK